MIRYENVSFAYNNEKIFDKINVQINDGDYVLVVGPNGAGKSTFIKCMLGLVKPTEGTVYFDEVPLKKFTHWQKVGYVAQRATHMDVLMPISVYEVVSMGMMKTTTKEAVLEKLKMVGMDTFIAENIHTLSGGQQQRVFIARALMSDPDILVFDEPTVGLDIDSVKSFYELISRLHEAGKTIIMVTHDMHTLSAEATRIISINKKIEFDGTRAEYQHWHENLCLYCGQNHKPEITESEV